MSTLVMWAEAVVRAAGLWEAQSEELTGAVTTLGDADPTVLGPVVTPTAQEFLAHWEQRVAELEASAERFAEALHSTARDVLGADTGAVERLQGLLPAGTPMPGAPR